MTRADHRPTWLALTALLVLVVLLMLLAGDTHPPQLSPVRFDDIPPCPTAHWTFTPTAKQDSPAWSRPAGCLDRRALPGGPR